MRIGKVCAIVVAAFFLLSYTGCGFIQKLKARDRLNKGVRAYTEKNYNEATEFFKESIRFDPDLLPAYLYLATTYSQMFVPGFPKGTKEYEKNLQVAEQAIKTYQQVIEKSKSEKELGSKLNAMASIAALYDNLEEYDKAKEWCYKLFDIDPHNSEALYRVGVINWKIVNKRTGMQGELVDELKPEEKEESLKLIEEGKKALSRAIEINPNYYQAMTYLNLLYREEAKFTKDDAKKRELLAQADKYYAMALDAERRAKEEELKKGKKKLT